MVEELERKLDSFDGDQRRAALVELCDRVAAGQVPLPEPGTEVNIHCHTFFSYNTYGYSPSKFAWLARKRGLGVAGVVDFDVLDALEESLEACRLLGLKGCAGLESRVFVPEFADKVINSPGEPGISYHMGVGFPSATVPDDQREFLAGLRETAQGRNQDLMERVNAYLRPVELNYERDVLVLTPSGNATERHMCLAFARKAMEVLADADKAADFWSEKLGMEIGPSEMPESRRLLDAIRAKTMKRGGVGYVQPDHGSFPRMADLNAFILASGGIPVQTWLDGTSDGEQEIDRLLDVAMSTGAAAINVIPDRNYTPGSPDEKLRNLYDVIEVAKERHLPVVMGTEMNSPGQKFVDDLQSEELKPLAPVFLKGAHIVYAHSVLQRESGLGYTSRWAARNFDSVVDKNEFFEELGSLLQPGREDELSGLSDDVAARAILDKISG
ncbi:MAG: hypothetical protein JSW59_15730 [Phycisphaerales bacterium]|nr:MAG: hypothetical protein JSW59_15730 [Phycisphaerales bacterium]